ncbi:MAG: NYN domain-containing protein [Boseongicola sp. SB0662_bin_57]|nr:NYN domain-containing protein [Boseongicola sp. SB0662_bin_57]
MAKVAILVDGGYFLKRLPTIRRDVDRNDPADVAKAVQQLVRNHLSRLNDIHGFGSRAIAEADDRPKSPEFGADTNFYKLLYRTFYYDAPPYEGKGHKPISKRPIDHSKTSLAQFRLELHNKLRASPYVAVRLGKVRREGDRTWILREEAQKDLLRQRRTVDELVDGDFSLAVRQKGVDMRIGLDIASITLKRQADVIVLVSGDEDFVPAAKLARREGVQFILDPLWQNVRPELSEHIDFMTSGFFRPAGNARN